MAVKLSLLDIVTAYGTLASRLRSRRALNFCTVYCWHPYLNFPLIRNHEAASLRPSLSIIPPQTLVLVQDHCLTRSDDRLRHKSFSACRAFCSASLHFTKVFQTWTWLPFAEGPQARHCPCAIFSESKLLHIRLLDRLFWAVACSLRRIDVNPALTLAQWGAAYHTKWLGHCLE